MRFEVRTDSIEGVRAAHDAGALRAELCADLLEGGITPSLGLIRGARRVPDIRLHVMIRPRGGDFLYSDDEIAQMEIDISCAKAEGADGVVFGLLLQDGRIDTERTARLTEAARPMSVTFHRAFDLTSDPSAALEALIALGVERLLTSGQEETAMKGLPLLTDLVRRADGRIIVMPSGGINAGSARMIVRQSGCREIQLTAQEQTESPMRFRRANIPMGIGAVAGEYARPVTSARAIRAIVERMRS